MGMTDELSVIFWCAGNTPATVIFPAPIGRSHGSLYPCGRIVIDLFLERYTRLKGLTTFSKGMML